MSQLGRPPKLPSKRIPRKNAEHIQHLIERNEQLAENNMRLKALLKENGIDEPNSIEGDMRLYFCIAHQVTNHTNFRSPACFF